MHRVESVARDGSDKRTSYDAHESIEEKIELRKVLLSTIIIHIIISSMKVAHQWLKLHVFRVTAVLFTLLCIAAACIIGLVYYINGPAGISKLQQKVDLSEYYFLQSIC